jgi:ATP-dependent helicase HrpB
MKMKPVLPVDEVLEPLSAALGRSRNAVLVAEPGAGKTTRAPLALMDSAWLGGRKIVMLEPRRVAARAAARFMARSLGEKAGECVGYSVRFERCASAKTKIEIVTEGVLTRRLQADPMLAEVGLIIFDEFHERSLEGDLALAFALDIQEGLRPDLRLLVMSATLDADAVAKLLGDAPIIRSPGKAYPVETHYLGRARRQTVASDVAEAARLALKRHKGSLLAFLPGEAEIHRCASLLKETAPGSDVDILPLYGSLSPSLQDRAIAPSAEGWRKAVLATTIAETSLTIEGVSVVIDGGFKRVPRFDPGSAMTRLETVRVSAAAAEQRRGRAGRLGPGVCYRLWREEETLALAPHDSPEILKADLAPFLLELANWGISDAQRLKLLEAPPAGALSQAKDLLTRIKAIDEEGRITEHGKRVAKLPLHPRLAHMVVIAKARGEGGLAADIAAVLQERDMLKGEGDASLARRLSLLRRDPRYAHARLAAQQIRRIAGIESGSSTGDAGGLLALGYSDRIAEARDRRGFFRLASGQGAWLEEGDPLARESFLAVATTDGQAANAHIFLAAPITRETIDTLFGDRIDTRSSVHWDKRAEAVSARSERRLDALVLEEKPLADADAEDVVRAMIEGVKSLGLSSLPWSHRARSLQSRVAIMRRIDTGGRWPDLSDAALSQTLAKWLKPYLHGKTRRQHLMDIDMVLVLRSLLPGPLMRELDQLLPERIQVPSGSTIEIDYQSGDTPILRVKLQEMFGVRALPGLAKGRLKLKVELLSPAGRPLAVTQDLTSFWSTAYPQVRSEMRGRYPKHHWPEDPLSASPSRGRRPYGSAPARGR